MLKKHSGRKFGRRFGSRGSRFGRKFGKISGLQNIMGNYAGAGDGDSGMSSFQKYTGMSADQMAEHLSGIPTSVRSNFYTNIV